MRVRCRIVERYRFVGLVLDCGRGPQLVAVVLTSLPPQGSGPPVDGWDWHAVEAEEAGGVRWGEFEVIGTFDGRRFTLTEPARPAPVRRDQALPHDFSSPCPEPAGGWTVKDPAKVSAAALDTAMGRAAESPGFAGAWVCDRRGEGVPEGHDPADLVLNVRCAGDLARERASIREVWGGALCLSPVRYSEGQLHDIQRRVFEDLPGPVSGGTNIFTNQVDVELFVVTDEIRERAARLYGPDAVSLSSVLTPIGRPAR